MPSSQIVECCDCLGPFCCTCDQDHTHCPDCKHPMCEACSLDALQDRQCRCASCHDPDTATVMYPGGTLWEKSREIYRHYVGPVKGKLD